MQLPPLTAEEIAGNRAFQLMTARPFPWSREVWALLLDRLFAAGARLVIFDLVFNPPNDGDPAFRAALDRYRDQVVIGANFDFRKMAASNVTPNDVLIPPPQLQDDRVGFVNFFPDPIDGKISRCALSRDGPPTRGFAVAPRRRSLMNLLPRALWRKSVAGMMCRVIFDGHMIRFSAPDAFDRARSTRFSIPNSGMRITPTARFLRTRS